MKAKPKRPQEKVTRNAWIVNEVLVKGRKQVKVQRQWNGLVKDTEKITRQRVHAIVARARKRLREAAEKEGVSE